MGVWRYFRLHKGDLLHLALQDEEAVVVEIDAALAEKGRNVAGVARLVVDEVFAGVVLVGHTADHHARFGHHFIAIHSATKSNSTVRRQYQ